MSKLIKLALLLIGCLFLGWAISTVDLTSVLNLLKKLGWGFLIIFMIYAVVTWLDTLSWKSNFRPEETQHFTTWELWRIRQVGEAYNTITPFATLGGEPLKAQLLKEHQGLSIKQGLASQVISKTTFLTGLILFFIPGITLILNSPKVSGEFKTISLAGMGIFSTCILLFFVFQITGILGKLCIWFSQHTEKPSLVDILDKLGHLNNLFSGFYEKYPGRVANAVVLAFLGWVLGLGEMYVTLYFLGFPISFTELWVMEALAQLVKIGSFLIPLSLGAQEGGLILIFSAFGYPANLGLTVSLVRRIKELFWVGLGLALGGRLALKRNPPAANDN